FFLNTLVLRVDTKFASHNNSLSNYFAHIRKVHLEAQSNQDIPFERLVERLNVPRSSAHSPLFQIMMTTNTDFGLSDGNASFKLPGVDIQPYQADLVPAKFDLNIGLNISEQGGSLFWTYDVSLFTECHITQLNEHMCRLLEALAQSVEAPNDLLMLSTAEIGHQVHELNDTAMDYAKDQCIHELFEQQAATHPNDVALVFEDRQLTYKELNDKANQLAHYLKDKCQVRPDTLVGLCVERSLEMVIGIMGILKAGGAYVPLEPDYPQARLNYMLQDAALDVVLSQTQVLDVLADFNGTILTLDGLADTASEKHLYTAYPTTNLSAAQTGLSASNLAYVIYTSGSTGQPKGVMTEHRSLQNFGAGFIAQTRLCRNDVGRGWLWLSSFVFDASLKGLYLLASGVKLILPTAQAAKSPEDIVRLVNQHNIGILNATPQLLALVVKTPGLSGVDLISSGEAIGASNLTVFKQFAQQAGTTVINGYGPTESTINSCFADITRADEEVIGRPVGNTVCYVLTDDMTLAPFGAAGELYIGGDGLARGYLNRPELTAQYFIDNPFYDENTVGSSTRLYRTGDLVRYLPDENLAFVGRADQQLKIRGLRIEPGEIEAQLAQLEMVDSAVVLVSELTVDQQLVGYVKPQTVIEEADITDVITSIKALLGQQLPRYMVPDIIMLVDEWPLTASGKVDKSALPAADGSTLQGEYVAPETQTEQVLVDIWAGLLNIAPESVSTLANFFDLGGHSLLTIRLVSEIRVRCEVEIPVQSIFDDPTL
ncbi:MAG: amino acid adenylation domain-containing protein, partial [Psychrosphaera sp.]|nr:amino acid adenylation domain-containing protein [Psychrosphaera sp.]